MGEAKDTVKIQDAKRETQIYNVCRKCSLKTYKIGCKTSNRKWGKRKDIRHVKNIWPNRSPSLSVTALNVNGIKLQAKGK